MGIIHKKIKIKVTNRIISKLKSLNYTIDKEIEIWQEDLIKISPTSKIKVEVECDNCHKKWNMIIQNITRTKKYVNRIFCKSCADSYVRNNFHDEIQQETKKTFLQKYGVEHNFQTEECLKKREETWLKNYGVKSASQADEVKKKRAQTLYKNGTTPTSKEQEYICNLFHGDLNKPIGFYLADIVIESPGMKIDIEIDGWAHKKHVITNKISMKEFLRKEEERNNYILNNGYKIIRLIINNKLPNDKALIRITNVCVNKLINGENIIYFDLENLNFI